MTRVNKYFCWVPDLAQALRADSRVVYFLEPSPPSALLVFLVQDFPKRIMGVKKEFEVCLVTFDSFELRVQVS